jgi:hypothetical protein
VEKPWLTGDGEILRSDMNIDGEERSANPAITWGICLFG